MGLGGSKEKELVSWRAVAERANHDSEFRLHARFWTARVRFDIGDERTRVEVRDGRIDEAAPWFGALAGDLVVAAPETEWDKLLEPLPRPFYQDLYAATVHHGFLVSGATKHFCAYYPALRRLIEIMREVRHAGV